MAVPISDECELLTKKHLEGAPLRIVSSPEQGRYVVCTRDLKSGEELLNCRAFAFGVHASYKKRVCHNCGSHCPTYFSTKCTVCSQVWYCSSACLVENADVHAAFCPFFRTMPFGDDKDLVGLTRTCLSVLEHLHSPSDCDGRGSDQVFQDAGFDDFLQLQSHALAYTAKQLVRLRRCLDVLEKAVEVLPPLCVPVDKVERRTWLLHVVSRVESNCFGFVDDHCSEIGRVMFTSLAFFNHSCSPTAELGLGLYPAVIAKQDIAEGMEITIQYINTNLPLTARRKELEFFYHFTCVCERCNAEEHAPVRPKLNYSSGRKYVHVKKLKKRDRK